MTWRPAYLPLTRIVALATAAACVGNASAQMGVNGGTPARADLASATAALPETDRHTSGNPLWAIPLTQLTNTRERPIFSPSRRPPPPVAVAQPFVVPIPARVERKPPERPSLALVGTITGGGQGLALFAEPATHNIVRLRTGEGHQGWVLRSVRGREAMLDKDSRTGIVALAEPGSEQRTAEPPARPPPPDRARRRPL